ncbi:MAG: hypothetical protein IPG64_27575 [Haliea sp.]|nr:hypothetical protein [Haliea sp.]
MSLQFLINYKTAISEDENWPVTHEWDLFFSAFNDSRRVQHVFEKVRATDKHWLIMPEYGYQASDYSERGSVFAGADHDEAEYLTKFFDWACLAGKLRGIRICVDITGFMRPHILFLLQYLAANGVESFDVLYSEPSRYSKGEATKFSDGRVLHVRPVAGYEGQHISDTSRDFMVIGVGYDHDLIAEVAEHKDHAQITPIYGLPSLSADMYQQSRIRSAAITDGLAHRLTRPNPFFCNANDPFVTAHALQELTTQLQERENATNLYFSPLGTKAQVLGFGLFYLHLMKDKPASIIFPCKSRYQRETGQEIRRIWKYEVRLRPD